MQTHEAPEETRNMDRLNMDVLSLKSLPAAKRLNSRALPIVSCMFCIVLSMCGVKVCEPPRKKMDENLQQSLNSTLDAFLSEETDSTESKATLWAQWGRAWGCRHVESDKATKLLGQNFEHWIVFNPFIDSFFNLSCAMTETVPNQRNLEVKLSFCFCLTF